MHGLHVTDQGATQQTSSNLRDPFSTARAVTAGVIKITVQMHASMANLSAMLSCRRPHAIKPALPLVCIWANPGPPRCGRPLRTTPYVVIFNEQLPTTTMTTHIRRAVDGLSDYDDEIFAELWRNGKHCLPFAKLTHATVLRCSRVTTADTKHAQHTPRFEHCTHAIWQRDPADDDRNNNRLYKWAVAYCIRRLL